MLFLVKWRLSREKEREREREGGRKERRKKKERSIGFISFTGWTKKRRRNKRIRAGGET